MAAPPPGTPVASVILSELHTELRRQAKADPYLRIMGRGVLTPGVVIPNEWWEHERIIERMEVSRPQKTTDGVLAVDFRCRCLALHIDTLLDLIETGVRELIEREIVPPFLLALGMSPWAWSKGFDNPLPPVTKPFGTPVDWDSTVQLRPLKSVMRDLIKLAAGNNDGIDRDLVLQEAADNGMLASGKFAALVENVKLPAPEPGIAVPRPPRVRVIDT
jgi:hypothetical protein